MEKGMKSNLKQFNHNLIHCTTCPRLVEFRTHIAAEKRKQFRDWDYWGKPVPGYGDPKAEIIIVGLAPAAMEEIEPAAYLPVINQRIF